jgi:hypothetical protein
LLQRGLKNAWQTELSEQNARLASEKERISNEHIAAAQSGAAKANERAAQLENEAEQARASIADANARAAQATQRAAEAQLALEKLKTPRTLGPIRRQTIVAAIRSFAGQRYTAAISQAADDGVAFWESLYVTLQDAGWIYVPSGPPSIGNPPAGVPIAAMPGIEIRIDPAKEQELAAGALALGNALHADGTVTAVNRHNKSNPNEADQDIILIVIGVRVPPP